MKCEARGGSSHLYSFIWNMGMGREVKWLATWRSSGPWQPERKCWAWSSLQNHGLVSA